MDIFKKIIYFITLALSAIRNAIHRMSFIMLVAKIRKILFMYSKKVYIIPMLIAVFSIIGMLLATIVVTM